MVLPATKKIKLIIEKDNEKLNQKPVKSLSKALVLNGVQYKYSEVITDTDISKKS